MLRPALLLCAAFTIGCADAKPTAPDPVVPSEIDRLSVFVRDWPEEYVEFDFRRSAAGNTLVMYRPPQPGVPRVLIDSIGPSREDPPEIVQLLDSFNVWAMADSNAAGAACSTRSGGWVCNPTINDYSLVMYVIRRGEARAQRYTRLESGFGNPTARALGDFVFAWSRSRTSAREAPHARQRHTCSTSGHLPEPTAC